MQAFDTQNYEQNPKLDRPFFPINVWSIVACTLQLFNVCLGKRLTQWPSSYKFKGFFYNLHTWFLWDIMKKKKMNNKNHTSSKTLTLCIVYKFIYENNQPSYCFDSLESYTYPMSLHIYLKVLWTRWDLFSLIQTPFEALRTLRKVSNLSISIRFLKDFLFFCFHVTFTHKMNSYKQNMNK